MSRRILITGTTGDSMPPPYAGIPNVSLLYARTWKKMGQEVGVTFVYRPEDADDLGANARYFFEYSSKPNKLKKLFFLIKYFIRNPLLYFKLLNSYLKICPRLTIEVLLYSAYGIFMDGVIEEFKPDIILAQAALIKTFMICEIAKIKKIPVVFNTYAEVHDLRMGVNKHLDKEQRDRYWTYFLNMSALVIGMDNCSVGPLMYLPPEKVKVFYDTCDYSSYQVVIKETKEDLRESFGLPHDLFLVAMMGAFHYRKGHDQLIKAISILKKKGIKVGATIVGGPVGLQKWIDLAKTEDVQDRVFFFQDFSEDKKIRLYKCIDAYANLSNSPRSCGLDLALLEAMSCALPIVVYDNGALPSSVDQDKNGFVVETGNIEKIAEAIQKLYLLSEDERVAKGKHSSLIASKTDVNLTAAIKLNWFEEVIRDLK
ncbi:glycosyltransferase family 4 protein [Patescibacteria group bacterium]|nr:glycosyltransferase family 4 protein [Patescibacteria group bacterium]